jgi:hypothetical protein
VKLQQRAPVDVDGGRVRGGGARKFDRGVGNFDLGGSQDEVSFEPVLHTHTAIHPKLM